MDKVYSIQEATKFLGLHRNKINELLNAGIFKGAKMGNKWVMSETEIKRIQREGY